MFIANKSVRERERTKAKTHTQKQQQSDHCVSIESPDVAISFRLKSSVHNLFGVSNFP